MAERRATTPFFQYHQHHRRNGTTTSISSAAAAAAAIDTSTTTSYCCAPVPSFTSTSTSTPISTTTRTVPVTPAAVPMAADQQQALRGPHHRVAGVRVRWWGSEEPDGGDCDVYEVYYSGESVGNGRSGGGGGRDIIIPGVIIGVVVSGYDDHDYAWRG